MENIDLVLDAKSFTILYKEIGKTTIFGLDIEGEKEKKNVLIYDFSLDPVKDSFYHIDFYEAQKDKKMKVSVPLVFIGESDAVKSFGGILVKNIYKIEVEAFAHQVPHEVSIDITSLKTFNDIITLTDVTVPPEVKVNGDPKEVIAKVLPPRTDEELNKLKEEVVMQVDAVKVETTEKKEKRDAAKVSAATE